ncbi:MAG: TraR/DksA C4-type zinc finger protein [Flavobacteriaceae bacterium]
MLNKKEIRQKIELEIQKTTKSITTLKEFTKPIAPDCAIGRVSRMDAINNKTINDNALRKAELKLKSLTFALQNLEDSDFGICARCKKDIPIMRILIMPHSPFCVHCVD